MLPPVLSAPLGPPVVPWCLVCLWYLLWLNSDRLLRRFGASGACGAFGTTPVESPEALRRLREPTGPVIPSISGGSHNSDLFHRVGSVPPEPVESPDLPVESTGTPDP